MKLSTVALSFLGFCVFYICNADWMDHLYETLIEDYEEVAPFVSSVAAGADEFDQIIEEFTKSKRRWYQSSVFLSSMVVALTFSALLYQMAFLSKGRDLLRTGFEFLFYFRQPLNSSNKNDEKIQNLPIKVSNVSNTQKESQTRGEEMASTSTLAQDDPPVKLLWQGGTLVESSVDCNVLEDSAESKILRLQKQLLQSKLMLKCAANLGGGDKSATASSQLSTVSSEDDSTILKIAEIRRLLESEPEMIEGFKGFNVDDNDEDDGTNRSETAKGKSGEMSLCRRTRCGTGRRMALAESFAEEDLTTDWPNIQSVVKLRHQNCSTIDRNTNRNVDIVEIDDGENPNLNWDQSPDLKLMNRIRLLENRLRIEELKNKNWINRMSRAEGILKQLNEQVERMEESRPMETRTETLKITSTVTNWASSSHPRRNTQFTLVNRYQPFYLRTPCLSLSEVIEKEIGLTSAEPEPNRPLYPIPPKPPTPALMSSHAIPQPSFFSKFLSR